MCRLIFPTRLWPFYVPIWPQEYFNLFPSLISTVGNALFTHAEKSRSAVQASFASSTVVAKHKVGGCLSSSLLHVCVEGFACLLMTMFRSIHVNMVEIVCNVFSSGAPRNKAKGTVKIWEENALRQ